LRLNRPLFSTIPAANISATASMMPVPQMPAARMGDCKLQTANWTLCSFAHTSHPITLNRTSSVAGSIRTRSMAPGAARIPWVICAPSSAGPVGLDAQRSLRRLPSSSSLFVPASMINTTSSCRCGASARITPTLSAPT
jgi:hypothetical protein